MVQAQSYALRLPIALLTAVLLILTTVEAQSADACDLPGISCPPATQGQCNSNMGFPYPCSGVNLCCTLPAVCIPFKSSYVCFGGAPGVSSTPKVAGGGIITSPSTPPNTPKTSIPPSPTSLLTTTSRSSTSIPPVLSPTNAGAGVVTPLPLTPSTPISPLSINSVTSRSSTSIPSLSSPTTVNPGGSNNTPSLPASSATRIATNPSPASQSVAQSNVGGNGGAAGGQAGAGSQTLGNGGLGSNSTPLGTTTSARSTTVIRAAATPRPGVGLRPGWIVVVVAVICVAG